MKRQNSITLTDFTNFLRAGALIRYGSDWILSYGAPHYFSSAKNEEISAFFPDFYDIEESPAQKFTHEAQLTRAEFVQVTRQYLEQMPEPTFIGPQTEWTEPDLNDFTKAFSHTQQLISQGQIDKAVPCVFAVAKGRPNKADLVRFLLEMVDLPESLYVYGYWNDEGGLLGATPEILFEKKGPKLTTMALAGTMPKTIDGRGELLLKNKKELHENQLVVDDLKKQLTPLGRVRAQAPEVLELPTLWHLLSRIEVDLFDEESVVDLVKRLHPTPALGVAPRRFGWRWMKEWPQQNLRSRFGAPFLMKVKEDHWICLVAIRNIQWNSNQTMIGSGCGVVRDSELEREWLELFYKRESVKKILGLKK